MHYIIFLLSLGTTNDFKFQISYPFKKIIMIIKIYHIITIDITQTIDRYI